MNAKRTSREILSLYRHLQIANDGCQESPRLSAGHRAVIEGQRERQDFVNSGLAVHGNDLIANDTRAENRDGGG